uniref:Zygote arrest 1-like n=1 Tax=Scleropages formosus TaxID=113540 RepID=A0A8C9R614_SCLFO
MEGFVFSPYSYNMYPGCGPYPFGNQKGKQQSWSKKGLAYPGPEPADYLELCKRAQLRAILSQVNPNLAPRLRKANTKEFGVQVNPRVDAVVQCSLGPKTLFYREKKWLSSSKLPPSPDPKQDKFMPSTPVNNVRFSRPVAIYSPVFDRRFFTLPDGEEEEERQDELKEKGGEEVSPAEEPRPKSTEFSQVSKKFNFQVSRSGPFRRENKNPYRGAAVCRSFLEQKYGFFHCSQCNIRWESAYVWCISGTNKVYFKQLCRKCQVGFNPYRVESIQCQGCGRTRCSCEKKQRHIDMKRPHRQDLCGRCKGKRLSCDTTYSFKYIV